MYFEQHKRMKFCNEENIFSKSKFGILHANDCANKEERTSKVTDHSDVFALPNLLQGLADGKYGSVTKECESLHAEGMQVMNMLSALRTSIVSAKTSSAPAKSSPILKVNSQAVIDLDVDDGADFPSVHQDSCLKTELGKTNTSIIVLDSDEEDGDYQVRTRHVPAAEHQSCNFQAWLKSELQTIRGQALSTTHRSHFNQSVRRDPGNSEIVGGKEVNWQPSIQIQKVFLNAVEKKSMQDLVDQSCAEDSAKRTVEPLGCDLYTKRDSDMKDHLSIKKNSDMKFQSDSDPDSEDHSLNLEIHQEDDGETLESDGLEDLWREMSLAVEYSKNTTSGGYAAAQRDGEECNHSYLLKDDMGLVCRICGVIQKSITTIFDYQWRKGSQSTRTYISDPRKSKDDDERINFSGPKLSEDDLIAAEISIHPRHLKQMKPHQIEGFNFLVRNLVGDKPGGCILAHAPGSGKTFMLISFIQSFLAKYPLARPLVILPKGILPTWKREFLRWQVEDIPLYDFYSTKADNRPQQFDVLKSWQENKSILFLGYKQFSIIVCTEGTDKIAAACKETLLKVPSLLILDEGHTPRNEDTNILYSIAKVQTPRKVVLSGTLFQNHVREVFNILNLARHNFLKLESSRAVVRRILSRVQISGGSRRYLRTDVDTSFFELVEDTLQHDDDFKRKVTVIRDLREMTQDVLHYYKGDFLDELPGLVDFTVLLNLSSRQRDLVPMLRKFEKFKRISVGSCVYIHPQLKEFAGDNTSDKSSKLYEAKIDGLLDNIDFRDGVKTKFFLDILSLSESAGEKVLVFSQYLPPLRFLERLIIRTRGWRSGKEVFMISGDTSADQRERSMELFNNSPDAKVFFGSIKACGEGISLVGASRVVILDVHLNPSVSRQAIGRAFRPGQTKKVYIYRLVAADSPEEEDHNTCFRKELIARMWFEWSEFCGNREFELEKVDVHQCQDFFLENLRCDEDVKALYRR